MNRLFLITLISLAIQVQAQPKAAENTAHGKQENHGLFANIPQKPMTTGNLDGKNVSSENQSTGNLDGKNASSENQSTGNLDGKNSPSEKQSTGNLNGKNASSENQSTGNLDGKNASSENQSTGNLDGKNASSEKQSTGKLTPADEIERYRAEKRAKMARLSSALNQENQHAADRLLQGLEKQQNPVISSPGVLVILKALSLGADGSSLSEINAWLGAKNPTPSEDIRTLLAQQDLNLQQAAAMFIPPKSVIEKHYQQMLGKDGFVLAQDLTALNQQISKATDGKIPQILTTLPPNSRLVLAHALHFSAHWQNEFQQRFTSDRPFQALIQNEVKTISVPTMSHPTIKMKAIREPEFTGILLPFVNDYALLLAMPNAKKPSQKSLAVAQQWLLEKRAALIETPPALFSLFLPKWKIEQEIDLQPLLKSQKLKAIFSFENAHFPQISAKDDLFVSQLKQKVTVDIHEKGGEATAATTVVLTTRSIAHLPDPIELHIDKPFVYQIMNLRTGLTILNGYLHCPASCVVKKGK